MKLSALLAPAILSTFTSIASAQENIVDAAIGVPADLFEGKAFNNPFDCSSTATLEGKDGPLSSSFANAYWANNECGNWDVADEHLKAAPQPETDREVPKLSEIGKDDGFAKCYYAHLPFADEEIVRTRDILDGSVRVEYGPYNFTQELFEPLHRAIAAECVPAMS